MLQIVRLAHLMFPIVRSYLQKEEINESPLESILLFCHQLGPSGHPGDKSIDGEMLMIRLPPSVATIA